MCDKLNNTPEPILEEVPESRRIEDARKWWESEGKIPREGKLEEISREELNRILEAAKNWPTEDKEETATVKPARLAGYKLNTAELAGVFEGAQLIDADLRWVDLWGARLGGATLWRARLQGAMLARATFEQPDALPAPTLSITAELNGPQLTGAIVEQQIASKNGEVDRRSCAADLTAADFRDADLGDAKLSSVIGLRAEKLAGTNLTNAKLPRDIAKFDRLSHVEKISHSASTTFFGLLAASLYSWLTIATTTDVDLITNRASSPLPIINTPISLAWFYWAAPLILIGVYLYLHLYLQRLWQSLSALPAVFPDGEELDEKAYPWLLNGLVRAHLFRSKLFVRLKRLNRRPLFRLEYVVTIVLAWGVIPITLLAFWWRYLPRQDWGTWLHVALLALAAGFGVYSYRLAVRTLRDGLTDYDVRADRLDNWAVGLSVLAAVVVGGLSLYAKGNPTAQVVVPVFRTAADLRDADISIKPSNWTGRQQTADIEIAETKGADLRNRDLRHASAAGAFLVKARLNNADLTGAQLQGADLRNADLSGADLSGADLSGADLSGADLREADLEGANLQGACRDEKTQLPEGLTMGSCPMH